VSPLDQNPDAPFRISETWGANNLVRMSV